MLAPPCSCQLISGRCPPRLGRLCFPPSGESRRLWARALVFLPGGLCPWPSTRVSPTVCAAGSTQAPRVGPCAPVAPARRARAWSARAPWRLWSSRPTRAVWCGRFGGPPWTPVLMAQKSMSWSSPRRRRGAWGRAGQRRRPCWCLAARCATGTSTLRLRAWRSVPSGPMRHPLLLPVSPGGLALPDSRLRRGLRWLIRQARARQRLRRFPRLCGTVAPRCAWRARPRLNRLPCCGHGRPSPAVPWLSPPQTQVRRKGFLRSPSSSCLRARG
jgi:hypothetical protein